MNTISRFKGLTFFLIAIFLLFSCGEKLQQWVDSDDGPNYDNYDDQGGSGGNNGSGGD
jgi:hypothetical protein